MSGDNEKTKNPFIRGEDEPMAPDEAGPISPAEDERLLQQERERRAAEADMEVQIIDSVRDPNSGPVEPVRLRPEHSFCFSCHPGVPCWNVCCFDTDITLAPYDILRLSRRLKMRPAEFLSRYTVPAVWEKADLPVAKLRCQDREKGERMPCVFLDEEKGCTVYEDRPASCRYYPLGLAAVKLKGHEEPEDFFFLVKEPHCKGHEEDKEQTIAEFRKEQGVERYDLENRGWIYLLMKMTSWNVLGGPWGKKLDPRTKQMFFMATTDVDGFRRFVFETRFLETYDIEPEFVERLKTEDELLLQLAFDWLKHILFNESTIKLREDVLKEAIARARRGTGAA